MSVGFSQRQRIGLVPIKEKVNLKQEYPLPSTLADGLNKDEEKFKARRLKLTAKN